MAEGTEADHTAGDHPEVERMEVDRTIAAEPAAIFEVLADPAGHVSIDASGMLMSAEGDPASAVDDRFVVHMDRDSLRDFDLGEYEVTVVITAFDQDREIAWTIDGTMQPPIGHVYGYRLEPIEGGTRVTSYYDWSNIHELYREANIFPVISENNLRATLGILARTVAPGAGRPDAG
ncbi:MAG: SRPBCC family protein [Candidatus Microthrix sp.]|nr:SRPBCC family protein [Candidatus Microthrix sp.]